MENGRIFKLEVCNLNFIENVITYHETDQKS